MKIIDTLDICGVQLAPETIVILRRIEKQVAVLRATTMKLKADIILLQKDREALKEHNMECL